MDVTETREQTIEKIRYYLPRLSDEALRMVATFMRGLDKNRETRNE